MHRIWCAIVTLATEITAWMQLLALTSTNARRWEPKRLRLRLFSACVISVLGKTLAVGVIPQTGLGAYRSEEKEYRLSRKMKQI